MARALLGHVGSPGEQALAYEVARLRRRVQELESELTRLTEQRTIDLELHRMAEVAEPEPALA
jgi:50S ribosomal subunit-associated GTPase HflX